MHVGIIMDGNGRWAADRAYQGHLDTKEVRLR